MRLIVLGSAVLVGAILPCAAQSPAPAPSPIQAWQVAMSRKLTQSAARENHECRKHCPLGKAMVGFVVHRDGTLSDIRIVDSSGKPALDERLMRAVRLAAPLPPIPAEIAEDTRAIEVPIRFVK